jgi:hypothetical protein
VNADPTARHVALDPYQATRFADCGLQFLEEAGVDEMVELHAEESQIALPRFLGEARRFHLAFVDGNHRFDGSSSTSDTLVPHATCSGLRPEHGGWEVRIGAFALFRGLGENARAHGRGGHHQGPPLRPACL